MRVTLYARVSSEAQEKQQTIESQLGELRAHAEAQGLALAREFVDDGYSGSMLERPGLDALRDAVAAGQVDTILCLCPDRLSRNFLHLGILLEEFEKHGARVVFLNQQVDDTPEGKLLLQIQGAVGEYERAKILDRTRRGRQHKARQGLMPGGQAPYGYDYVPGDGPRWRVNEEEAVVVREVYRLLNEDGRTLSSIAKELVRRGIRTKRGSLTWGYSSLHRMLKNEAYAGTAYFSKEIPVEPKDRRSDATYRRRLKTSQRKRDRSEWIPVPVAAIIDRATWERAQERLQENAHFNPRNNKRNFYLLRGLLKCGACGHALSGQAGYGTYYECRGLKPLGLKMTERCHARKVRTDRIEPIVWEAVKELLDDPEAILEQLHLEEEAKQERAAAGPEVRRGLERRLTELDAEEMQVVRLFRGGKIGEEILDAQLREVAQERSTVSDELQAYSDAEEAQEAVCSVETGIREFCASMRDGLEHLDAEGRQQVLRLLVDRIEIDPDGDRGLMDLKLPVTDTNHGLVPRCQRGA